MREGSREGLVTQDGNKNRICSKTCGNDNSKVEREIGRYLIYGRDFWFRIEGSHPEEKLGQAVKRKEL